MTADRAADARFELTIEKFDENRIVTLHQSVPKLLCYNLIGPTIAVFHFDVWFFCHGIHIFMHGLQQHRKHLLRVMLGKTLELYCFACHPILHIPWRNIPLLAQPNIVKQFGKCHCKTTPSTQ